MKYKIFMVEKPQIVSCNHPEGGVALFSGGGVLVNTK